MTKSDEITVELVFDGQDYFVIVDGVKIAKRQDGEWVQLEPGWTVVWDPHSSTSSDEIEIHYEGVKVQGLTVH